MTATIITSTTVQSLATFSRPRRATTPTAAKAPISRWRAWRRCLPYTISIRAMSIHVDTGDQPPRPQRRDNEPGFRRANRRAGHRDRGARSRQSSPAATMRSSSTDATGVTLDHLSITGAYVGVYAPDGAASDHLTVTNCDIYGNITAGHSARPDQRYPADQRQPHPRSNVFFASGIFITSSAATISGNTLYLNGNNSDSGFGIWVNGADTLVTGNETYSQTTGIHADYGGDPAHRIIVSKNLVHNNARTGIEAGAAVLVTGNAVYGQLNSGCSRHQQLRRQRGNRGQLDSRQRQRHVSRLAGPRQPRLSQHAHRHSDGHQRRRRRATSSIPTLSVFRTILAAITTPRRC